MSLRITVFGLLLGLAAGGCSRTPSGSAEDLANRTIRVVATTGMVADLAREIGADRVEVAALMGPGVDPHLYTATAGDVERIDRADLILYNGLHLEGKMGDVLESAARDRPVVAVTDTCDGARLLGQPGADYKDPHVWFDVALWAQATRAVGDALAGLDPTHADGYRAREAAYRERLEALDAEVRAAIGEIPEARRVLITSHDAFRYFGRAYGIEVAGLQGISTVVESGLQERAAIVDLVIARGVKALFVESSVSPKAIEAVLDDLRRRGHDVKLGGKLFSDAMGGDPETSHYVGMVRANVRTIVEALR